MIRHKLLFILLILGLGICSGLFAQVNITVGDGTLTNGTSGVPTPYGTYFKNFRQQFLYTVADIEDAGGGAGPINSLAFNVADVNNCSPMPNFQIRIKTTEQTEFTTTFEAGDYTLVFTENDFLPIAGMNVHNFIAPFQWDGSSNLIVDIMTSLIPGAYTQNASVYYTATGMNKSLRFQSDSAVASEAATGSLSVNRSNITFNMNAIQITNPPNPALLVTPANGSTILSNSVDLTWASGGGIPSGYKLYFGTTNPPPFVEDLGFNYTHPVADLQGESTYYWQIVPYNTMGDATNCPVWSFSTLGENQLAESFEDTTFPPVGWANGSTGNWTRSTSTPLFHGAAHAYKFTSATVAYQLSTPMLAISAGDTFEFYTRATNVSQILQVAYSTDRVNWTQIGADVTYADTGIWYPVSIDLTSLAGNNYYLAFITPAQSTTGSIYVDHVIGPDYASITPAAPTLTAPANNAVNVSNFPNLSWTAGLAGGVPTGYNIYLDTNPNPTTLIGTSATTTYSLTTGLNYNTQYYWKVAATNAVGSSDASEVFSFTTMANPTISEFPWIEDFGTVTADWPVLNWTQLSGLFPNPTGTSTQWFQDDWLNATTPPNKCAKINIYGTARYGWLVTPPVVIPADGYELKFDIGLTQWNQTTPILDPNAQLDDKFIIAMSDSPNMANPVILREYNNAGSDYVFNEIPHTGTEVTLFLTGVTGTKYFAFYGESTATGGDNDLFVDNVQVRQTPTGPVFTINPANHDFGTVLLGSSPSQQFRITNTGIGSLGITSINLPANPHFTLSNLPTLPVNLSIGESITFDATFAPVAEGNLSAVISITDNLGREVHEVTLSGVGFDATISELPVSQNWDAVTTPAIPVGWSKIVNSSSTSAYVQTSTTSPYSTPNCVQIANSADAEAALYLISPPFANDIAMNTIRIKMMAKGGTSYLMDVGTMSNPTDPSTFALAQQLTVVANWNEYVVNLTGHVAAGQFIAFRHALGGTYRTMYVDDITFEVIATNDLAAIALSGNTTPQVNTVANYQVSVYNNGTAAQNAYHVRLYTADHTEIASAAGTAVAPGETVQVSLAWTPTEQGLATIYGKVILAGDANPANDSTNPMNVNVTAADVFIVDVGNGTDFTGTSGTPTPYGTFYKNFRQQFLYTAADLSANGMIPGAIYALAFNVQGLNNCSSMPNYRIRMKTTEQTALTTTFEVGEYTQVWHHANFLPEVGWNMHVFDAPFFWDGASNVIVDILTDLIPGNYTQNAGVYYTATPYASSLRYQSDSIAADTATTGSVLSNRSNTRFYLNVDDMGSLTGTVTENGAPLRNVTITIEETVFTAMTNNNGVYNFSHAPVGTHTVTASKAGYTPVSHTVTIVADQQSTQNFAMVGTPDIAISDSEWNFGDVNLGGNSVKNFTITNIGGGSLGITNITIAGSTTFALSGLPTFPANLANEESITFTATFTPNSLGEENATITITDNLGTRYVLGSSFGASSRNSRTVNTREVHTIALSGNGVNDITIGAGDQEGYYPINFYFNNSLFETIYTAEEMNGFVGMITGVRFYTNFNAAHPDKPAKIWLGSTTQTDLSAGWIPSTDLTLVYDGIMSYPEGEAVVSFEFPEYYMHLDGGNLVMLVQRPMDTGWVSGKYFKTQEVGTNRSRNLQSDSTIFDPANPADGTLSGNFPKTTFVVIPGGVGHITGTVTGAGSAPLSGVLVSVDGRPYSATTDQNGQFHIANVLPGDYAVTFSRHGYVSQTVNIVLDEDETEVMNVTMNLMAQVTVSGTVLASDTAAGIAGAAITLTGYENYSASTVANGTFTFPAVFANQSYDYTITAAGYTSASGSITVGSSNYAMGSITLTEIAYAPNRVSAELNGNFSAVEISWFAPDPNALEITESFESVSFPPTDWSQVITDSGPANTLGVYPTWCNFGAINVSPVGLISPTDGSRQAGLWWSINHQDEWLKTPVFNCPPDGFLRFDTFAEMGSANGDHYYVKVSVDGGNSWNVLWDASTQAAGSNVYDAPITVDLSQFSGQQISLAFHAEDPPSNDGLWYTWFIDNIYIGNFVDVVRFDSGALVSSDARNHGKSVSGIAQESLYRDLRSASARNIGTDALTSTRTETRNRNNGRALTGYKVWRLMNGQEGNETNWTLVTPDQISNLNTEDTGWATLPNGTYKWAVKAVYTNGVLSVPAFSNTLVKELQTGQIVGFVRRSNNVGIPGATVTTDGGHTATTNSAGAYSLTVPVGTYQVTASATGFHSLSYENILVSPNTNTTQNFVLTPTSNEDEMVPVTVTALNGNYPNPFNPETNISYDLKDPAKVRLDIYNLKGQLVRTLVDDNQAAGRYRIVFNSRDNKGNPLASGIYLYRLRAGDYVSTRKMMLME